MDIQTTKLDIKAILENKQNSLTEDNYRIIDTRRESHLKGESKSYSWKEARAKIESR